MNAGHVREEQGGRFRLNRKDCVRQDEEAEMQARRCHARSDSNTRKLALLRNGQAVLRPRQSRNTKENRQLAMCRSTVSRERERKGKNAKQPVDDDDDDRIILLECVERERG